MPKQKPYLIFDVGGTLVIPNQEFLLDLAKQNGGQHVSQEMLFAEHCKLIYQMDDGARVSGKLPHPWPDGYIQTLFRNLKIGNEAELEIAAAAAAAFDRANNIWTYAFSWSKNALETLADQGYRMSVISNADGRVTQQLKELKLFSFFEKVFDSKLLGVEKPDPKIFEIALGELSLSPEDAVYVGDVFYVDVWGANQVGLGGIHLDPMGFYEGWPGIHLKDISKLPGWLAAYQSDPDAYNLMPTVGESLVY